MEMRDFNLDTENGISHLLDILEQLPISMIFETTDIEVDYQITVECIRGTFHITQEAMEYPGTSKAYTRKEAIKLILEEV